MVKNANSELGATKINPASGRGGEGLKPETSGVQSQRSNRSATKIIPIIFMAYGRRELEKIIIITK